MGGRLTEFDRYEKLTGWGTPRPVYGPKHSAVPIGSHLPNDRPKLPQQDVFVGPRGVEISLEWAIDNGSTHDVNADYRIRLNRRKGGRDETWFEYHPNKGVTKDIVSEKTGQAHKIITKHGASLSTKAKAVSIPGGRKTVMPIGFTIPGPAQGRDMQEFWKDRKHSTFNLLVAVYQVTVGESVELDKGEHEFSDILELRYDPSAPTPYSGRQAAELPMDIRPIPRSERIFSTDVYQGPTTELPAIPYGPRARPDLGPGEVPSWFVPSSGKVPTRRSKLSDVTVQTYDPDTGDPW
tara:strand:+ start:295 stop:1176 length:882 start_codon:yes stop_codon:yes gene_type:complete